MSLAVCLPAALASAAAYGSASALQHQAANTGGGEVDVRGIGRLLARPLWLAGLGLDGVGLVLQVLALSTGPVSLVQPVQVLALLVAFPVGAALGGPPATRRRTAAAVLVAVAVGGFLALAGDPGGDRSPPGGVITALTVGFLAVGGGVGLLARRGPRHLRAAGYGAVSGAWFAFAAVCLRVVSLRLPHHGVLRPGVLVPLGCLLLVGAAALAMTQAAFQVGELADSLPAATASDPVVAVVLGVAVLGERLPLGAPRLLGYAAALVAVVVGARLLTRTDEQPAVT
jgi:drug/metabolite transporter (DMT)-like permease